jgi:hypothetical protein
MLAVIIQVFPQQFRVTLYNQQVLGVALLSIFGEIETAGNQDGFVQDHYLIMGNGMHAVDIGSYAGFNRFIQLGIFSALLAFIQHNFHSHTPAVGGDIALPIHFLTSSTNRFNQVRLFNIEFERFFQMII